MGCSVRRSQYTLQDAGQSLVQELKEETVKG